MEALEELAKHAPSFIWGGLALWALYLFRTPIMGLFPRLSAFKAAGVEMSFVERSMAQAAADANRNNLVVASTVQKHVEVTKSDRERVLARAERCVQVLRGKRILWLDDLVATQEALDLGRNGGYPCRYSMRAATFRSAIAKEAPPTEPRCSPSRSCRRAGSARASTRRPYQGAAPTTSW